MISDTAVSLKHVHTRSATGTVDVSSQEAGR